MLTATAGNTLYTSRVGYALRTSFAFDLFETIENGMRSIPYAALDVNLWLFRDDYLKAFNDLGRHHYVYLDGQPLARIDDSQGNREIRTTTTSAHR